MAVGMAIMDLVIMEAFLAHWIHVICSIKCPVRGREGQAVLPLRVQNILDKDIYSPFFVILGQGL